MIIFYTQYLGDATQFKTNKDEFNGEMEPQKQVTKEGISQYLNRKITYPVAAQLYHQAAMNVVRFLSNFAEFPHRDDQRINLKNLLQKKAIEMKKGNSTIKVK